MKKTRIFKVANVSTFRKYREYSESELINNIAKFNINIRTFIKKMDAGYIQVLVKGFGSKLYIKLKKEN